MNVIKRRILVNNNYGFSKFPRIINNYGNIKIGIEYTGISHVNLYTYIINNYCNIIQLNTLSPLHVLFWQL